MNPLLGIVNLTMAQDECVEQAFGPQVHEIEDQLIVDALLLNVVSIGLAATNEIEEADEIDANVQITGDTDLNFGNGVRV